MTGSKHTKEEIEKIREEISRKWLVINSEGNEFKIKNMNKFCRENNLSPAHMSSVAKGKRKQHKGYKCKKLN